MRELEGLRLARRQQRRQRVGAPQVTTALHALVIHCRERGDERARGRVQFTHHEVERPARDQFIFRNTQRARGAQVQAREQRIVVKHLFEVRGLPRRVHGITEEAAAELIVQSLTRHLAERQLQELLQTRFRSGRGAREQRFELRRGRTRWEELDVLAVAALDRKRPNQWDEERGNPACA